MANVPKLRTLTPLALTLALAACSSSPPPASSGPQELGNSDSLVVQEKQPELGTRPQAFMMTGEVILGHEVSSIRPCGSSAQYWLAMDNNLFKQGMKLVPTPYEPLYGEVIGYLTPSPEAGFPADYDATFHVEKLNLLSGEVQGCSQPPRPTRAMGNEPDWAAEVKNGALAFIQPGKKADPQPLAGQKVESGNRLYSTASSTLSLMPGACEDSMADTLFGWSATFSGKNGNYRGCAALANNDPTRSWAGSYQGNSAGLVTTLTLNPDHSASTVYQEGNARETIETGFWQQVSPQNVQVVMTTHQGQRLTGERLFHRDGFRLSANEEVLNGRRYSLGNDGLQLSLMVGTNSKTTANPVEGERLKGSAAYNEQVENTLLGYFKDHKTEPNGTRYRWLTTDLNGDGRDELLTYLDWCGSGGCTLLVFEGTGKGWQFNSRMTLVHVPFQISNHTEFGWHDLILPVGGGGQAPANRVMRYDGISYPQNPSVQPEVPVTDRSETQLFADGLYPVANGRILGSASGE